MKFKKKVESFDGYSESMSQAEIFKMSQKRKKEAWELINLCRHNKITSSFIKNVESQLDKGHYITKKQIAYMEKCLKPLPTENIQWCYDQTKIMNRFSCLNVFYDLISKEDLEVIESLFDRFQEHRKLHGDDMWKLDSINSKYLLK